MGQGPQPLCLALASSPWEPTASLASFLFPQMGQESDALERLGWMEMGILVILGMPSVALNRSLQVCWPLGSQFQFCPKFRTISGGPDGDRWLRRTLGA